jgi:hypothetical protein
MFSVLRQRPRFVVPKLARRIAGSREIVIAKVAVRELRSNTKRIIAAFAGSASGDPEFVYVLSPDTLSRAEWGTLRAWRPDPGLVYSIGMDVADHAQPALQSLLPDLLRTRVVGSGALREYILLQTDPQHAAKLGILCLLEDRSRIAA